MFFTKLNNSMKASEFQAIRSDYRVGAMREDDEYLINTLTVRITR